MDATAQEGQFKEQFIPQYLSKMISGKKHVYRTVAIQDGPRCGRKTANEHILKPINILKLTPVDKDI